MRCRVERRTKTDRDQNNKVRIYHSFPQRDPRVLPQFKLILTLVVNAFSADQSQLDTPHYQMKEGMAINYYFTNLIIAL